MSDASATVQPLTLRELLQSRVVKGAVGALAARIVQVVAHRYGVSLAADDVASALVDGVLWAVQVGGAAWAVYGRQQAPIKDALRVAVPKS